MKKEEAIELIKSVPYEKVLSIYIIFEDEDGNEYKLETCKY